MRDPKSPSLQELQLSAEDLELIDVVTFEGDRWLVLAEQKAVAHMDEAQRRAILELAKDLISKSHGAGLALHEARLRYEGLLKHASFNAVVRKREDPGRERGPR